MKLIADSGSTKTDWTSDGRFCTTSGINPFYIDVDNIVALLEREFTLNRDSISSVVFYGAGALPHKAQTVFDALQKFFGIEDITVETDLLGAARALCGSSPGIACILGTGSNSCYYDGRRIVENIPPLGFILGDEGSGASLGRRLLADLLRGFMPRDISDEFEAEYGASREEILENVYRKAFPNRYMAGFVPFIADRIDRPEIAALVDEGFAAFIHRNVLPYREVHRIPICFVGSVAYVFRANLEKAVASKGLELSTVIKSPLSGLMEYHSVEETSTM